MSGGCDRQEPYETSLECHAICKRQQQVDVARIVELETELRSAQAEVRAKDHYIGKLESERDRLKTILGTTRRSLVICENAMSELEMVNAYKVARGGVDTITRVLGDAVNEEEDSDD